MLRILLIISILIPGSILQGNKIVEKLVKKPVAITGKIKHRDPARKYIDVYVFRVGFMSEYIKTKIHRDGTFNVTFNSYIPTDVCISYNSNFNVLTRPWDHVQFEFDGRPKERPAILKTLKFNGDYSKTNNDVAQFQYLFYSNPLYNDWKAEESAFKDPDIDRYMAFLNRRQKEWKEIYVDYVKRFQPTEDAKLWSLLKIEHDFYNKLPLYISEHKIKGFKKRDRFYAKMLNRLPLKRKMLLSGYTFSVFINRFHMGYIRNRILNLSLQKTTNRKKKWLDAIIKHTPDPLLRQLVMTEFLRFELDRLDTELFENNLDMIKKHITEPYLIEPLMERCYGTQKRLKNPKMVKDAFLKDTTHIDVKSIMNRVLLENQGKIIYVDVWATWCKPCKDEMKKSKKMMKKYEKKAVAFIFFCIDSEKAKFKGMLDELGIGGQHYFFDKSQSQTLRSTLKINGIPHYILIGKDGKIIGQGFHMRPEFVEPKIDRMLGVR